MDIELLRVSEAAALLGIGRTKCYELVAAARIPVIRIDGVVRIPKAALLAWIADQTAMPSEEIGRSIVGDRSDPVRG
jgi:excisionase family DNA binding protein